MLSRIKEFFSEQILGDGDLIDTVALVRRAAAALMIEVSRVDYDEDPRELEVIREALRKTFQLDSAELDELVELARQEAEAATSSYGFTQLVNTHFDEQQKRELIAALWRVAYADGRLDKYEEHLVRRVAELIYVPHSEFIRLKLEAAADLSAGQG